MVPRPRQPMVNNAFVLMPAPRRKERPILTEESRATPKVVLQDITDRYLASPKSPLIVSVYKLPKINSPALKQWHARQNPSRRATGKSSKLSSSLPPSSPPPLSSQYHNFGFGIETDDDPFGFFAVEQKLKARRAQSEAVKDVKGKGRALEEPDDFEEDKENQVDTDLTPNPLQTPHKQRVKRREPIYSPSVEDLYASAPSSAPSTPSPLKRLVPHSRQASSGGVAPEETEHDEIVGDVDLHGLAKTFEEIKSKIPTKRRGRPPGKKTKGKRKLEDAEESSDEEIEEPKKRKRGRPKGSTNKKKVKEKQSSTREEDERLAREREARLEYFRKLEGYHVQTENVYVV